MFEAVMNLALIAVGMAVMVLWVMTVAESDGKCHMKDCDGCPYDGDCPMKEEQE